MSLTTIGVIGIVIMLVLMFMRVPLGVAMAVVGFVGVAYISGGIAEGAHILATSPFRTASTYMLTVIPLFILMGMLASNAGLSEEAFYAVNKWLGHLPGGLAIATVGGCTGFVCGG